MDPRFYEAWFNTRHVVLGCVLHPFCLEDALILSMMESPFLLGQVSGIDYSMTDLQIAVKVCSTPSDVFLNARLESTRWSRLRSAWWTRSCSRMNLELECQRFVTYVDDFNSSPRTWSDGDAGDGKLRSPWVLANATFLIRNTTFTPREVWTMPLGMALWYCATISEQLGAKIQLLSDEERKALIELGLEAPDA